MAGPVRGQRENGVGRDFAALWTLIWELGVGACALFALLNAFAPPQDLPWTPLDLNRPLGAATTVKVASLQTSADASEKEVERATEACLQTLRDADVEAVRVPDRSDGGFCVARGLVRITGGDVTPFASRNLVMQCPLAVRYALWDRQVLRPAARELGSEPARVDDLGTYACRRIYGSQSETDRPSEHSRANAIDIGGVRLKDGRTISVLKDWNGQGPAGAVGAAFLKQIRDGGCRLFSTVLTPDYNAAHADHLHLDAANRGLCAAGPRPQIKTDAKSPSSL
jgi:hypothetical protein